MLLKSALRVAFFSLVGLAAFAPEARADWPMYNHDISGTRSNPDEHRLSSANVGQLAVEWSHDTPAAVTGTPAVKNGTVYAGDFTGAFYALRASDGSVKWQAQAAGPVSGSALVRGNRVIFGDLSGYVYGLNRKTGAVVWQIRPNDHPWAAVYGSATPVGPYVAIGISSNEWFAPAAVPGYSCCTFRGSVAMLDPEDGEIVWQRYFITPAEAASGAAGAPVWSTPTYDPSSGLLYTTTGNNYKDPGTALSDSIIALDAANGHIVWANQRYQNDTWNVLYPPMPPHPDYDIGDSPQIYHLPNGRKVVGAGQKSGFYHVVDAATGQLVNTRQFEKASTSALGGLFADSAVVDGTIYANGGDFPVNGDVIAFSGDAKKELWRFHTANQADLSGVAVANGVVYFSSLDGNFYALRASDGALRAQLAIDANTSGPSVDDGHVYVGTGNSLGYYYGILAPGSIKSLTVPVSHHHCDDDDDDDGDD